MSQCPYGPFHLKTNKQQNGKKKKLPARHLDPRFLTSSRRERHSMFILIIAVIITFLLQVATIVPLPISTIRTSNSRRVFIIISRPKLLVLVKQMLLRRRSRCNIRQPGWRPWREWRRLLALWATMPSARQRPLGTFIADRSKVEDLCELYRLIALPPTRCSPISCQHPTLVRWVVPVMTKCFLTPSGDVAPTSLYAGTSPLNRAPFCYR
jgi:hypothetical protein